MVLEEWLCHIGGARDGGVYEDEEENEGENENGCGGCLLREKPMQCVYVCVHCKRKRLGTQT